MPKKSKKEKKKVEKEKEAEAEKEIEKEEGIEEIKKTSIMISTKVRDRLWRLKFRKTYDEFLWELCEVRENRK
jgi:hypothetical protein